MPLLEEFSEFDNAVRFANRIELLVFVYQKNISKTQLRDILLAVSGSDSSDIEIWIGSAFSEIRRRQRVIGESYPCVIEGPSLKSVITNHSEFYKFFVLIAESAPFRTLITTRFREVDILFDEVVRRAVTNYLGSGTLSLRFGSPASAGRPNVFSDAIQWLCEKLFLPIGPAARGNHTGDAGVDLVFWKPFPDKRGTFLLALFQCTMRANWLPKRKDVLASEWLGYISSGRTAITGLAVPFVISAKRADQDAIKYSVRIFFDRVRLAPYLLELDLVDFPEMFEWNARELARIT